MDPVLAELFGTLETGPTQEEIEKTASLDLLQKIAEAHEIDLDQLTDDQLVDAVNELEGVGFEKEASEEDPQAAELFANSKLAGEIMAHSMVRELKEIQKVAEEEVYSTGNPLLDAVLMEKEAGPRTDAAMAALRGARKRVAGSKAGQWAARQAGKASAAANERLGKVYEAAGRGSIARKAREAAKAKGMDPKFVKEYGKMQGASNPTAAREVGKELLKRRGKQVGIGAGIAAGLGTAGYAGSKMKNSFDEAVYERAAEHLAAAGLIDQDGDLLDPGYAVKTAQDVDAAALGLLEEMGYPVEWYEG